MSKQTTHQQPVPDLFKGMAPEECKDAEEALTRYFGLLWRVAGEYAEAGHVAELSPEMQEVSDRLCSNLQFPPELGQN